MRIIISPAKKMREQTDIMEARTVPVYIEKTRRLAKWLEAMTYEEAKDLWKCSDTIAGLNYDRMRKASKMIQEPGAFTPALLAYDGIQYQYMAPSVFTDGQWDYVQEHLRILSGFYGILCPLDGVLPYRLEMQAKGSPDGSDLYRFWGDDIYRALREETGCIVNLASREYALCVENWLETDLDYVTCVFGEKTEGKIVQKGVRVKMARGEMVRFMAENAVEDPRDLKKFDRLGYRFSEEDSKRHKMVFLIGS